MQNRLSNLVVVVVGLGVVVVAFGVAGGKYVGGGVGLEKSIIGKAYN